MRWLTLFLFLAMLPNILWAQTNLDSVLEPIRVKYNLPALAGAIFNTDGIVAMGAVGVRKRGTTVPVTQDDLWHLGSDTKVMTAMLAATYVNEGKLRWNDRVMRYFPEIADQVPGYMKIVTLGQILSHQAGLVGDLDWFGLSKHGSLPEQRLEAAHEALTKPTGRLGHFAYSNLDYVVIGCVLERISGKPWEELMQERLFQPLGMTTAGFGGTGTLGQIDQPWPHLGDGSPTETNGPLMDNAEVMGPAGCVHCSMHDWALFLIDQLKGGAGLTAFLPNPLYERIQRNWAGQANYGYGWIVCQRDWAGGTALNHCGSNTMNYCNCWLAPNLKFGVLVCTNQGGDKIPFSATDDAVGALITVYQAKK